MAETVLVFRLADHGFALPAARVRECLPLPLLRRRPGLPPHLAGFMTLGGAAVPVVDLARLLGLRAPDEAPPLEADGLYRHLLLLEDGVALLVDRATELAAAVSAPADRTADGWQNRCVVRQVLADGEPVALLDPDRLLRLDERERLRDLTEAARRRGEGWAGGPDAASGADADAG